MKKHTFKEWFIALRPWALPASAMPIIVTLAFLFFRGSEVNWLYGLWALIGMILFHLTGNVWSDYFDFKKKVDSDDTFGAKTMTTGMFRPDEIKRLAIGLFIVSIVCGLGIVAATGLTTLYIGIAGAVFTLLYPTLKYNALGDLDILLTFAFLPTLGTSYVVTGTIDWNVLWIALPVGLITDAILHSNNTRDILTDKRAGITTMAMGIGTRVSAWFYGFEVIFPYLWVVVCSVIGIMPLIAFVVLLSLPMAIKCVKPMMHSLTEGSGVIAELDMKTAQLQLAFSLLLSIALIIGKIIQ